MNFIYVLGLLRCRMRSLCPKTLDHLREPLPFLVSKLLYARFWLARFFTGLRSVILLYLICITASAQQVSIYSPWLGGLSGIGLGLGPGGQPIDANQLNRGGGGMGNMGPGGNQNEANQTLEFLCLKSMTNSHSCCRNGWHGIWKHGRRKNEWRYVMGFFCIICSLLNLLELS